jgi:hypothetical protein
MERLAATIAVVQLKASINGVGATASAEWILRPGMRALTSEQLIQALAAMPKPLECEAAKRGRRIIVRCVGARPDNAAFSRLSGEETARRLRSANEGLDSLRVLVTGAGDSVVVPLRAYELWSAEYYVRQAIDVFEFDPPPPEAVAFGAHMLLRFSASG